MTTSVAETLVEFLIIGHQEHMWIKNNREGVGVVDLVYVHVKHLQQCCHLIQTFIKLKARLIILRPSRMVK